MCRHMEMRKKMARLGLPWLEGQKTKPGRYIGATAGSTKDPGPHSEDVRRH